MIKSSSLYMPIERRRQPNPDPSEFPTPRAEKTYWVTERLLDEAPPMGELKMRFIYDNWHQIYDEFLQKGESDNEARQIAWGATIFFGTDRLGDVVWEVANGRITTENIPSEEMDVIKAWNDMAELHAIKEIEQELIGEPFFSITKEIRKDLNLHNFSPTEIIDPDNPNSPTFGHIQLLDKMADRESISEELKNSVLSVTTNEAEKEFLEYEINSWNRILIEKLPERVEEEHRDHILETTYGVLTLQLAQSWGDEETIMRRLELLDIYLSHFRHKPNQFQDFLSLDGFESKFKEWAKRRGEPETDEEREYHVPGSVLSEIKFRSFPEMSNFEKPNYYSIELDAYKGLNFALIITWVPELQVWLGHSIISFEEKQPPRSITSPIRLLDVKSPAEALTGLIHYYKEHLEAFRPYKSVVLTNEEKKEALERLNVMDIRRLGPKDDSKAEEEATESARSLLSEIDNFRKFPPIFTIAVQHIQTKDIYWGVLAIKDDAIVSPSGIHASDDLQNFIELVDHIVTGQTKEEKVLVCSDSIYQSIIKDEKSKVRSTVGRKSIVKRPGGLITIYRGRTLQ